MLEIDMEFRKGILFVRLIGSLISETVDVLNKEVTNIVKEYGISNIVFNVSELDNIDLNGIKALIKHQKLTDNYHGISMICGLDNHKPIKNTLKKNKLFDYLYETSDELSAIKKINS